MTQPHTGLKILCHSTSTSKCCRSLVEEARAIALKAAQEQREKLLARAREAEAAKAAAEAAEAGAAASPAPETAAAAMTSASTPQVCNLLGQVLVTPMNTLSA